MTEATGDVAASPAAEAVASSSHATAAEAGSDATTSSSGAAAVAEQQQQHELKKFPLRRIEPFVAKFVKKLQQNVNELRQQTTDVEQLVASSTSLDNDALSAAFQTASNSTAQLVVAVDQIEQVRRQVNEADLPTLDCRLFIVFNDVAQLLVDLLVHTEDRKRHDEDDTRAVTAGREVDQSTATTSADGGNSSETKDIAERVADTSVNGVVSDVGRQATDGLNPVDTQTVSDEKLQQIAANFELKLLELNDKLQQLYVKMEHATTDVEEIVLSLEHQPTLDVDNPHSGSSFSVHNLKLLMIPVAGAVIGGAIAGPVGLVAGLKVGKLAAVGGGLIGLTGGTILKKKTESRSAHRDADLDDHHDDQDAAAAADDERRQSVNTLSQSSPLMNVV